MILEQAIRITDEKVNRKISDTILGMLINDSEYSNYTLFDLINFFKIRRMRELDIINSLYEKELFSYYRKYNTKVKELEVYKNTEFEKGIREELTRAYEILLSYGIEPNKSKNLFHIEDMVNIDILQNSIHEINIKETNIIKQNTIESINKAFAEQILVTDISGVSFIKLYNFLKIQLLAEQNYINKNNIDLIIELYNAYLSGEKGTLYKELSNDPYRLELDDIKFDFVTYIDYMIKKDYTDKKENPNYLNKEIK